jgi:4-amino-4-deoxy-L-arabinose transferase-like glycosyltransferase
LKLPYWFSLSVATIILFSIFVRIQGLGYSNFQGDEVNTVDMLYQMNNGLLEYLFSQKRGPVQYLLNFANFSLFGYHNEFWVRVPYLITGVLAIYTLYKLAKRVYGSEIAFLATLFISVNGLFIAFARITQYQSLMYFTIPIAVLVFIYALSKEKLINKYLVISGLLVSFSLLIHYDTASVLPFFVIGFIAKGFRDFKEGKKLLSTYKRYGMAALVFFVLAFIPALSYYVPFFNHKAFSDTTSGYLEGRLFGSALQGEGIQAVLNLFMPGTPIALKLLRMYIPQFFLFAFYALGFVGIFSLYKQVSNRYARLSLIFFTILIAASSYLSLFPIKPRLSSILVVGSALAITFIITFSRNIKWYKVGLITWFLGAYSFYFYIMKDARTHVYVSMIPLFPIAASGFYYLYEQLKDKKFINNIYLIISCLVLLFVSGINYIIFVDKNPEYPWWDKNFMGYEIYKIKRVRHSKIEGVFGFNNYRGWEQVADLYKRGCLVGSFNSNEKNSISYFYTRFDQKKGDEWGISSYLDSDNIVLVEGPHSWEYFNKEDIPEKYVLLKTIYSNDVPVTYIYGLSNLYPNVKLLCN